MEFNQKTVANIFKTNWLINYNFDTLKNPVENIIENIKELENQNMFTNEIIMFIDNKKLEPLYVTKNIETILGYQQKQFLDWGKDALVNIGTFEEGEFWKNLTIWFKDIMDIELLPKKSPILLRAYYGGFSYNQIDGRKIKFLFRSEFPIGENNTMPDYHFARLQDIGHLLKEGGYWLYYEKSNCSQKITKFYSKKGTYANPISSREKEILVLISKGMSSKEIAKKLFISPETVSQHRKNMIKRLMTKDTSALIQICKLCNII